jgi:hypothetical protein
MQTPLIFSQYSILTQMAERDDRVVKHALSRGHNPSLWSGMTKHMMGKTEYEHQSSAGNNSDTHSNRFRHVGSSVPDHVARASSARRNLMGAMGGGA